jgi:hypothetical protein
VLAQTSADDTDNRFPVAVVTQRSFKDVRLRVKCKMVSGITDQAAGLVLRYKDRDNYYVTRANALEDNVRLYVVSEGRRKQLASWDAKVTPLTWHDYAFEAKGETLRVFWDGAKILEFCDGTLTQAGRVGLWTKSDSVSFFDDLAADALPEGD